ncbi:MAG TPA: hypothetical protein DHU55_16270 [Blastocatellia bacterium]|jgi:hypothetical protein|nr:hypothetical protein [Blastocatellia bacterium]
MLCGVKKKMTANNRSRNRSLLHFIVLPLLFLTVALLGGLRISADHALIFVAPPLVTFVLAVLLMLLFVRGRLLEFNRWVASDRPPLKNISHGWMLLTLFFASAQAFNSVLPERGLLHWLFSFFFLWTLWNNQFSSFNARRLLRSLTVLFGTAFVLKHMLLASLYSPDGGWLKRVAGALLQGVALGTLDAPSFAPATGYISFFTITLYVAGLLLLTFASDDEIDEAVYRNQLAVRESVLDDGASQPSIEESRERTLSD